MNQEITPYNKSVIAEQFLTQAGAVPWRKAPHILSGNVYIPSDN